MKENLMDDESEDGNDERSIFFICFFFWGGGGYMYTYRMHICPHTWTITTTSIPVRQLSRNFFKQFEMRGGAREYDIHALNPGLRPAKFNKTSFFFSSSHCLSQGQWMGEARRCITSLKSFPFFFLIGSQSANCAVPLDPASIWGRPGALVVHIRWGDRDIKRIQRNKIAVAWIGVNPPPQI